MTDIETIMRDGLSLAREERYQLAHEKFMEACARRPDSAAAWANRAGMAFLLGLYLEAENSYREAFRIDKTLLEARLGLIRVCMANRDIIQARDHLGKVSLESGHPQWSEWLYLSGVIHDLSGEGENASTAFQEAFSAGYSHARIARQQLMIRRDQPVELAAWLCQETRKKNIPHPNPLLLLTLLKAFPHAKSRWRFAATLCAEYPDNEFMHDLMASGLLHVHDYAYAARIAALARRHIPGLEMDKWPALKECAWF